MLVSARGACPAGRPAGRSHHLPACSGHAWCAWLCPARVCTCAVLMPPAITLTHAPSLPLPPVPSPPAPVAQLQLGDKMCLVREGKVVHVLATGTSTKVFPRVAHARPLVATPAPESGDVEVALWGFNLGMEDDAVLARSQGELAPILCVPGLLPFHPPRWPLPGLCSLFSAWAWQPGVAALAWQPLLGLGR